MLVHVLRWEEHIMFIFFSLNIRSLPFDEFVRRTAEETHKEFFLSEVKGISVIDWQLCHINRISAI